MRQRVLLILVALTLIPIGLISCVPVSKESKAISDFCQIALPIKDSPDDTEKTRQQVLLHNAKWLCLCQNVCPKSGWNEQAVYGGTDVIRNLNVLGQHEMRVAFRG